MNGQNPHVPGVLLLARAACRHHAGASNRSPRRDTLVPGTQNVYVFRNGGYPSSCSSSRPTACSTTTRSHMGGADRRPEYVDGDRKVTGTKPIKYLVYSPHPLRPIAGGQGFQGRPAPRWLHSSALRIASWCSSPRAPRAGDEVVGDNGCVIRLGGPARALL